MGKNGDRGAASWRKSSVGVEGFGDHWYAGVLVTRRRVSGLWFGSNC